MLTSAGDLAIERVACALVEDCSTSDSGALVCCVLFERTRLGRATSLSDFTACFSAVSSADTFLTTAFFCAGALVRFGCSSLDSCFCSGGTTFSCSITNNGAGLALCRLFAV